MNEMRPADTVLRPILQRQTQRGAGSLVVVMVLFFLMSLVAAYAGRNMIFEQRTSANQYRGTQAFEGAEGGVEWSLAMLNGGLVDAHCASSSTGTNLRTRMLDVNATTGTVTPKYDATTSQPLAAYCVSDPGSVTAPGTWTCGCPDTSTPAPIPAVPSNGPAPAFKLTFQPAFRRPGLVQLVAQSCTRLDVSQYGCLNASAAQTAGDAVSVLSVLIAIKGGIAAAPLAALTARGQINVTGAAAATLVNQDASSYGITVDAGGSISFPSTSNFLGLAGAPPDETKRDNDSSLPGTANNMFTSIFGMSRSTYKLQPAAIVLTCPAQCTASNLNLVAQRNPGRIIWLEGDAALTAGSNTDIGSASAPVVIVAHGQLTKASTSSQIRIFGLVYQYDDGTGSTAGKWVTAGDLYVQGATVAEGDVTGTGNPTLVYDLGILNNLRLTGGSFVRVPGGWQDFQ